MKVLLFHPTLLPPKDYGGVERVVLWLALGLLEQGHEVTVGALEGSVLPRGVTLLPISPHQRSDEVLLRLLPKGTDIVHFMAPPSSRTLKELNAAHVLTVHGNGKPGEKFPLNTVFLSADHAQRHHGSTFVYNGINPVEYQFKPLKKSDFLFLSKTSWKVKNLKGAMAYARQANVSLEIAGGNRPWSARARCLFNSKMTWQGAVSGAKKSRLLADAKALIFPVLWPEPFGLVMAEAWMSGTPVIANPRGSTREMVHSTVGILPANDEAWVHALQEGFSRISPEACRAYAESKFHYLKMAQNYESVYRRICSGETLNLNPPVALGWELK